ncbi:MAG: polyprenyl synthetase family protein [Actinobacteria bacterium]|nr:MAG: polyprenyl synthetase family protein [Actinomycetota bacterium]
MRYSLLSGGKRFRPILVLLAARLAGLEESAVLPTACAIEYIHTYSLIHDDLPAIDDDDMRRGRPSCHVAFGEDVAILAGDALFSEAFALIASRQKAARDELVIRVMSEIAQATGVRGMVGGQVVDVISSRGPSGPSAETVEFIHKHKTGKLITSSVKAGAILAEAPEDLVDALGAYGEKLGLAFQITDDILDLTGDWRVMGKPSGSDEEHSKMTFPGVYGIDGAARMAREAAEQAKEALAPIEGDTAKLEEIADFVCERER